jgi:hypothetical protein
MPTDPLSSVRISLLRCDACGNTIPMAPAEVRECARTVWPQCCGTDLSLYIEAERPGDDAREVTAFPLALPGGSPGTDTVLLPPPALRKPSNEP